MGSSSICAHEFEAISMLGSHGFRFRPAIENSVPITFFNWNIRYHLALYMQLNQFLYHSHTIVHDTLPWYRKESALFVSRCSYWHIVHRKPVVTVSTVESVSNNTRYNSIASEENERTEDTSEKFKPELPFPPKISQDQRRILSGEGEIILFYIPEHEVCRIAR